MTTRKTLREVRINQPHVFNFQTYEGRDSYGCKYLLPKGSQILKEVEEKILEAANIAWPGKGKDKLATLTGKTENCLRDGDLQSWEPYHGHMILTATRGRKKDKPFIAPSVFGRYRGEDGALIKLKETEGLIYGGVIANSTVEFWGQNDPKYPGMRCDIINLQFVRHAPAFGGGGESSDAGLDALDFEEDLEDDDLA
jgi:hypothetical protein